MPKLYNRYGTVGAAKTLNLLAVCHNYEAQGKKVLVVVPAIDTRFGVGIIRSRCGLERKADIVVRDVKDLDLTPAQLSGVACMLSDESQFYNAACVDRLRELTEHFPVLCYGLRTDFRQQLFAGSKRLMELADSIEEIKTTCCKCNRKAIFNLKHRNGKKVVDGAQVELGVEDTYSPVCSFHWDNFS